MNIIQFTNQFKHRALAISSDAEKVFDRVEWHYLFEILEKFGLGGDFLKLIHTNYHSPAADNADDVILFVTLPEISVHNSNSNKRIWLHLRLQWKFWQA